MTGNTQAGSVSVSEANGIGTITFAHPAHNSLPSSILQQLADTILAVGNQEDVRVIVLQSGGERTFCAGASFDELLQLEDQETATDFFMGFARVINACRTCGKLVIGRVQGKAVGGGVGLAAATDYCMATKFAAIKLSELAVGIGPFVVGPAVARKTGLSAMSQLTIQSTVWKSAEWAREKGLFTEVFDNLADLDEAVRELANRLSQSNPEALSLLKTVFWEGTEEWGHLLAERAAMSGKLVLSDYAKAAIGKFKRK